MTGAGTALPARVCEGAVPSLHFGSQELPVARSLTASFPARCGAARRSGSPSLAVRPRPPLSRAGDKRQTARRCCLHRRVPRPRRTVAVAAQQQCSRSSSPQRSKHLRRAACTQACTSSELSSTRTRTATASPCVAARSSGPPSRTLRSSGSPSREDRWRRP